MSSSFTRDSSHDSLAGTLEFEKMFRNVPQDAKRLLTSLIRDLPTLESVVNVPVFSACGELLRDRGYHASDRVWMESDDLRDLAVPRSPSAQQIAISRRILLEVLFGKFQFFSERDRANALAALLLPFARRLVSGPTPLHRVATGSARLDPLVFVKTVGNAVRYPHLDLRVVQKHDRYVREMLEIVLGRRSQIIAFECASRDQPFESPLLSSALESETWTDRVRENARPRTYPNFALWFLCDYGVKLRRRFLDQCVSIRFYDDSRARSDGQPDGDSLEWGQANGSRVVQAAATLIRAWIVSGKPKASRRLSNVYGEWEATMGGILEVAEVDGFSSVDAYRFDTTLKTEREREHFFEAWSAFHADRAWRVSDLVRFCEERGLLPLILGDGGERSKSTRLGVELRRLSGERFGDVRLVPADPRPSAAWAGYRLVPASNGK